MATVEPPEQVVEIPPFAKDGIPRDDPAEAVAADFGDLVPLILDAGPCPVGIESTIVDISITAVSGTQVSVILVT